MMRALTVLILLLLIIAALINAGCQSTGQRYHQGDRWEMYRLDKNYKPIRVR